MDTVSRRAITSLMRSDKRESEPGTNKTKPTPIKYKGLSRKQITVRKTTFRKGVRRAEVFGVAKHANILLGYLVYDDKGKVWRYQLVRENRPSILAHRTKSGAALMMCEAL